MSSKIEGQRAHAALYDIEAMAAGLSRHLSPESALRLGVYHAMLSSGLFSVEQARAALARIFAQSNASAGDGRSAIN